MADKLQTYVQLAQDTARQISANHKEWTDYLQAAARLYKYPYADQLLIYAQRPEATACAEYNVWNTTMHRYIRRGSKGIALLNTSGETTTLRYVFDISDTGTRRTSRSPFVWELNEQNEDAIRLMLDREYGVASRNELPLQLEQIAMQQATVYWQEHRRDLLDIVDGTFAAGYDELAAGASFRRAAAISATYMMLSRCAREPAKAFTQEDFSDVFTWNSPEAVDALGGVASEISGAVLRQIERTIRSIERSQNHERTDLHHERGLSPAQPDPAPAAHDAAEQVRQDAQDLPEGAQTGAVEPDAAERDAGQPSQGDRRSSEPAAEPDDAGDGGSTGRDGGTESQRPDGLDAADERLEGTGRGSDSHGAGLQLSFFDGSYVIPSESEQIQSIQQAESTLFAPFAFSIPQDTVDQILRLGSNTVEHRQFLVTEYSKGKSIEDLSAILRTTYHGGNGFETPQGQISVWYAEEGIRIARGTSARYVRTAQVISWEDTAKRIGELLKVGQFATSLEIASAPGRERYHLAESLSYVARDISDAAKEQGYFHTLRELNQGVYPDCIIRIAEALAKPDTLQVIADEYRTFLSAWHENHDLMRFRYHRMQETGEKLEELFWERRDFNSSVTEVEEMGCFITEDEITEILINGNRQEGWKERVQNYFLEPHTPKEKIAMLKSGYGIGGHSPAVSGAWHSDEWHDGKGIRLKKENCETILLGWPNVAKRIMELIQQDRYLTAEEKAAMEERQKAQPLADEASQKQIEEAIREWNGDSASKLEVVAYLREHGPDETGEWLAEYYGDDMPAFPITTEEMITDLPWSEVQQHVVKLIENNPFLTSEELLETQSDRTDDYRLLSRLRSDCDYFLGAGGRSEKHLWAGTAYEQIAKMRELYQSLPHKPEWLTEEAIDQYAAQMAPPYLVMVYHHFENGFDAKLDYQTLEEAEKAAQGYVNGTMEADGFQYDGAAVYDQQNMIYLRTPLSGTSQAKAKFHSPT